ncbi:MAG: hypothetical protein HN576_06570 [Bacteriovoracaceae bacterium]|jgi:hypothetical protein|nr:hypothetical protein [Bacteriovoracaceae bacterium]
MDFKIKIFQLLTCFTFVYGGVALGAELKYYKGEVRVLRGALELPVQPNLTLKHNDKLRLGAKSLAIIVTKASTVKISEHSTYILDLRQPEILSGTLSKGSLVVQFLKSKLIKQLNKDKLESKILKIQTRSASIAVRGTKFFTYTGVKIGSVLTVESGIVDFKGKQQNKAIKLNDKTSSLTNENEKALRPREFGFEKDINWNFESNNKEDNLEHNPRLYAKLEKTWEDYKTEQTTEWKNHKSDLENKWKNIFKD